MAVATMATLAILLACCLASLLVIGCVDGLWMVVWVVVWMVYIVRYGTVLYGTGACQRYERT